MCCSAVQCVITVFRDQSLKKKKHDDQLATVSPLLLDTSFWTLWKDLQNHFCSGKTFYSLNSKLIAQKWHVTLLCMPHELVSVMVPYSRVADRIMNPLTYPLLPMSRMALMGSGRWVGTMPGSIKDSLCVCVCMWSYAHVCTGLFLNF